MAEIPAQLVEQLSPPAWRNGMGCGPGDDDTLKAAL